MCYNVRNNPNGMANINYLAGTGQLTLFDTVSYDRKHNEANGEKAFLEGPLPIWRIEKADKIKNETAKKESITAGSCI